MTRPHPVEGKARTRKPETVRYWYHAMAAMLHGKVIARIWAYPSAPGERRCRSKNGGNRCMWVARHPLARHMTFLSPEAWPGGPPQSVEWGLNPNPYGKLAELRRSLRDTRGAK